MRGLCRPNLGCSCAHLGQRRALNGVRGMAPVAKQDDKVIEKKSTVRRDKLLEMQEKAQRRWEELRAFEADAMPRTAAAGATLDKFFGNFPYPYMNGMLHLGHAFSLSKLEFACAFWRLCGKNVLLPMGFHCTGMPIKACADKLKRELGDAGVCPPAEADDGDEAEDAAEQVQDAAAAAAAAQGTGAAGDGDALKFKGTKSKAAAKTGSMKYQWQIMRSMGIPDEEIPNFRESEHWLTYFPPLAKEDLKALGLGCDWRRSFITTDMNPYYDSFVRWQLEALRARGKVVKDRRFTIYSPLDDQPCADHDRATGEGVGAQEYVLLKLEVQAPFSGKLAALEGRRVFLAAATLRPETMYGQTNAWVLPDGDYGAFDAGNGEVFIVTPRAARNLAFQGLSAEPKRVRCLLRLTGADLVGLPLTAPLAEHRTVYALPMLSIRSDKGTGVVTSVPSDSPDDFAALRDLKKKSALRAKYGVRDEWVLPFEPIPIIDIPELGSLSAEAACAKLGINSQNDADKLEAAKKMTYLRGFNEGRMLVGEHAGMAVKDAKPLVRNALLQCGSAVVYSEPERPVVSRSGDECVVALTDQWYLLYGEAEWRSMAEQCLAGMNTYSDEVRHGFERALSWLNQWACSRSFGLGSRIPWDPDFLIESLSDSTLYMAYYTVAHILQQGDLYGRATGTGTGIRAEEMTPQVWDYVLGIGPKPEETSIASSTLEQMRQEFEYWYPFDLRVSGKDLIQNHLTFSIYTHVALLPKERWPKAFRCNGFLLLDNNKMSKSTGNFMLIREAVAEFSADATRLALADAGDGLDDGNFVTSVANSAILRLTKELSWMEEVMAVAAAPGEHRSGPPSTFADRVFDNAINVAVTQTEQHYKSMLFREALKAGCFDLQAARDDYRVACGSDGMNRELLHRYMDVSNRLLTPICPHYAEHVRSEVLGQAGLAVNAGWPAVSAPVNVTLLAANAFLQGMVAKFRAALSKQLSGGRKTKGGVAAAPPVTGEAAAALTGVVVVAERYEAWKEECLIILQQCFSEEARAFDEARVMELLRSSSVGRSGEWKQVQRQCMPFLRFKKEEAVKVGGEVLQVELAFDQAAVLRENEEVIKKQVGLQQLEIISASDRELLASVAGNQAAVLLRQSPPTPGDASITFVPANISPQLQQQRL